MGYAALHGRDAVPKALASQASEELLAHLDATPWAKQMPSQPSEQCSHLLPLCGDLVSSTRLALEAREKKGLKRVDSLEVCPICYSEAMDTRFIPCQHTSCGDCIARHLLNSRRCF